MNPARLQQLEAMGLGPVWVRRGMHSGLDEPGLDSSIAITPLAELKRIPSDSAIEAMDWSTLREAITHCTRCSLCAQRKQALVGRGEEKARWLFVGDGPSFEDDTQAQPFSGASGELLSHMLRALGLTLGQNSYVSHTVKCRPVGPQGQNRLPSAEESAACLPYLQRQIALLQPAVIISLGEAATRAMLPLTTSLASARGQVHQYEGLPLVVTLHPTDLLQQPKAKAEVWKDLCLARTQLDG